MIIIVINIDTRKASVFRSVAIVENSLKHIQQHAYSVGWCWECLVFGSGRCILEYYSVVYADSGDDGSGLMLASTTAIWKMVPHHTYEYVSFYFIRFCLPCHLKSEWCMLCHFQLSQMKFMIMWYLSLLNHHLSHTRSVDLWCECLCFAYKLYQQSIGL